MKSPPLVPLEPLQLLSVVIPAPNEKGRMAATVEHVHLELLLQRVTREIAVVDEGSTESTPRLLQEIHIRIPECRPIQNPGDDGFGRAITYGSSPVTRVAVVAMMMADESDDRRDVVRYWQIPGKVWDAVVGSRLRSRWRRDRLFPRQTPAPPRDEPLPAASVRRTAERFQLSLQNLPTSPDKRLPIFPFAAPQHHCGTATEYHRACIFVYGNTHHLAQPARRRIETQDHRDGQPLLIRRPLLLAGEILQPWRLPREVAQTKKGVSKHYANFSSRARAAANL